MRLHNFINYKFLTTRYAPLGSFFKQRLNDARVTQVAGNLTFTTLLSIVPVLAIAFAIFTTVPFFNTFKASLESYFINSLLPKEFSTTIINYLNLFTSKATRLSELGAVALIIMATGTMSIIERSFNNIWHIKTKRPVPQRVLMYWAIITLGPVLIGFSIKATNHVFIATTDAIGRQPLSNTILSIFASLMLTTAMFTLLYQTVPNCRVARQDALIGGLIVSTAFEIAKRCFAFFIMQAPTYEAIYGALAIFPIFILWIYISWVITLLGAVLVSALPILKFERWWHIPTPADAFINAVNILKVLQESKNGKNISSLTLDEIRKKVDISLQEGGLLLEKMQTAFWVNKILPPPLMLKGKRHSPEHHQWILMISLDQLRLTDVYRLFIFKSSRNTRLTRQVEHMIETHLGDTLSEYFASRSLQDDT